MISSIFAQKNKMRQGYDKEGNLVAMTVFKAYPLTIVQIKPSEKEVYGKVQIGIGERKKVSKPLQGHFRKAGLKSNPRLLAEFKVDKEELADYKPGQIINANEFLEEGDCVDIKGRKKGRGFAGVIKRWSFSSQPKTHGQSDRERAPGSIGSQTPGRVLKGKKMPGHYGPSFCTVKNSCVLFIKENEIWVKGGVPGPIKSWVLISKKAAKRSGFIPLEMDKKEEGENGKE